MRQTKLMDNIENQPAELLKSLEHTVGAGREALDRAAAIVKTARHVYITGIGSSWHAGMAVASLFEQAGCPVHLSDASELLHYTQLPREAALIILSRSGRSVEVVGLLDKARAAGAKVIGITNTPESPLGIRADVTLRLNAAFDHNISITMYSALTLVGGLLAEIVCDNLNDELAARLRAALRKMPETLKQWRALVEGNAWFAADAPAYFLARGGSMASASETRLLWEEGAKAPACAMTTGGFRHGPQEIIAPGVRIGLWLDNDKMREQDLALARDLRSQGVEVMLIGRDIPGDATDLVFELPAALGRWQFLIDIVPGQIAAEYLSRVRGVDCDSFAYCEYIIQKEGGLALAVK